MNWRHGHKKTGNRSGTYITWSGMVQRCTNPKNPAYKDYGGRGVTICKRWLNFGNFLSDMGERPGLGMSIERVKNDQGYRPSNCKWIPRVEQAKNRRLPWHVLKVKARKTCIHGHRLVGINLYIRRNGCRVCKTCRRLNMRRYNGSPIVQGVGK